MRRFSGVLMNCTGSGAIRRGVSVCSVRSEARMLPPPLPRTSRISPFGGSRPTSRTNSSTNASSSSTLNVKMRMWPNVPDAVSTVRARKTPCSVGLDLGAAGGRPAASAPSWRATTCGAKSSVLARLLSSISRSMPSAARAAVSSSEPLANAGAALSAISQLWRSSWSSPSSDRVADRDPLLVGRQVQLQRPDRQRVDAAGAARAGLLPAYRAALISTARAIGMPFQCVTSARSKPAGGVKPCISRETTYRRVSPSRYSSTWNGRNAILALYGAGSR